MVGWRSKILILTLYHIPNTVSLATKCITPILNENELSSSKDIHDLKISENTTQTSNCYSADQNLKSNKASNLESENVNLNASSLAKLFHKALEKLNINNYQSFTGVITFLELIVDDKFPLNNICFWLC